MTSGIRKNSDEMFFSLRNGYVALSQWAGRRFEGTRADFLEYKDSVAIVPSPAGQFELKLLRGRRYQSFCFTSTYLTRYLSVHHPRSGLRYPLSAVPLPPSGNGPHSIALVYHPQGIVNHRYKRIDLFQLKAHLNVRNKKAICLHFPGAQDYSFRVNLWQKDSVFALVPDKMGDFSFYPHEKRGGYCMIYGAALAKYLLATADHFDSLWIKDDVVFFSNHWEDFQRVNSIKGFARIPLRANRRYCNFYESHPQVRLSCSALHFPLSSGFQPGDRADFYQKGRLFAVASHPKGRLVFRTYCSRVGFFSTEIQKILTGTFQESARMMKSVSVNSQNPHIETKTPVVIFSADSIPKKIQFDDQFKVISVKVRNSGTARLFGTNLFLSPPHSVPISTGTVSLLQRENVFAVTPDCRGQHYLRKRVEKNHHFYLSGLPPKLVEELRRFHNQKIETWYADQTIFFTFDPDLFRKFHTRDGFEPLQWPSITRGRMKFFNTPRQKYLILPKTQKMTSRTVSVHYFGDIGALVFEGKNGPYHCFDRTWAIHCADVIPPLQKILGCRNEDVLFTVVRNNVLYFAVHRITDVPDRTKLIRIA